MPAEGRTASPTEMFTDSGLQGSDCVSDVGDVTIPLQFVYSAFVRMGKFVIRVDEEGLKRKTVFVHNSSIIIHSGDGTSQTRGQKGNDNDTGLSGL